MAACVTFAHDTGRAATAGPREGAHRVEPAQRKGHPPGGRQGSGTSKPRATAPTAAASHSPRATKARSTPCTRHLAVLQRGKKWQLLSARLGPFRQRTAALVCRGRRVVLHGRGPEASCNLYRFAIDSEARRAVAVQGGWVQGFDVAADVVATVADAMDHPGTRARTTRLRRCLAAGALQRHPAGRAAPGPRTKRSRSRAHWANRCRCGWCTRHGFDRKKKHPVLHSIHGGPHAASGDTFHYRWNNHVFAAQGYVVACVNYHGSSGFGHTVPRQHHPPLGRSWSSKMSRPAPTGSSSKPGPIQPPRVRHRRQLWRLHGGLVERPREARPLPGLCVPCRLLRLDGNVCRRRLHLARQGSGRLVLGRSCQGRTHKARTPLPKPCRRPRW